GTGRCIASAASRLAPVGRELRRDLLRLLTGVLAGEPGLAQTTLQAIHAATDLALAVGHCLDPGPVLGRDVLHLGKAEEVPRVSRARLLQRRRLVLPREWDADAGHQPSSSSC